jgi:anti-sigma B factor antagonist
MEIVENRNEHFVTLSPQGELDANSSIDMDEKIQELLEAGVINFHIDCTGLRYISSAGLGVFISYLDEIKAKGGKIIFSNLSTSVHDVFKLLGLTQIVTVLTQGEEVAPQFIS